MNERRKERIKEVAREFTKEKIAAYEEQYNKIFQFHSKIIFRNVI